MHLQGLPCYRLEAVVSEQMGSQVHLQPASHIEI